MNVLVYFDKPYKQAAQHTITLLAEKFAFDLDLLAPSATLDLEVWSRHVRGAINIVRAIGPFEQAVIRACSAKHYDLVIAVPADRSGIVRTLLGSRIGKFVSEAPATIWVARGERPQLKRIVVGVSGGPQSEQDARLGARLAKAYGARLELAYVASQVPLFYTTFEEFHEAFGNDATMALMAPGIVELRRIHSLLSDEGVDVRIEIRVGVVSDELVAICQGEGKTPSADLLVIGAHARQSYSGTDYLENLTEEITTSAPCPTLVVHAKSAWTEWEIIESEAV